MASTTGSLDPGTQAGAIVWRQHRIFDRRTTKTGFEFDVELRGNGKRRSQWIPGHDVDARLVRQFNAKSRSERSHQKEILNTITERHSQTILILTDDEEEEDGSDDVSVISITSSEVVGSDERPTLAAGVMTPRRSGRERQVSERFKDFVPHRIRHRASRKQGENENKNEEHVHVESQQIPVLYHCTPNLPDDDSYKFLTILSDESDCASRMESPDGRANDRTTKVPPISSPKSLPDPPQKGTRTPRTQRASRKRAASGDAVRKSQRLTKTKHSEDELTTQSHVVPVTGVSVPMKQGASAKAKTMPRSRNKREGVSVIANPVNKNKETERGVKQSAKTRSSRESTSPATRVSRGSNVPVIPVVHSLEDELTTIAMEEEDVPSPHTHISATVSLTPASFVTPTTPPARPKRRPETPMSEKIVRTSTTKSGRMSVSRIEDNSFVYDVNAMAREDADIQRRTKVEEARVRKKKQPEFNAAQFYQNHQLAVTPSPEVHVTTRRSSDTRHRLSTCSRPLFLQERDIEEEVLKQKRMSSVPVEIKGQQADAYVVEFSKGTALRAPAHVLERHFPDQMRNLMTQRSTRMRPVTPAPSIASPNHFIMSPGTPRTPVQIEMFESNPPSPDEFNSCDGGERPPHVPERRNSVASLISDIEVFDAEEPPHEPSVTAVSETPASESSPAADYEHLDSAINDLEQENHSRGSEAATNGTTHQVDREVEHLDNKMKEKESENRIDKTVGPAVNGVLHQENGRESGDVWNEMTDSLALWQSIDNHMREEPLPDMDIQSNGDAVFLDQL